MAFNTKGITIDINGDASGFEKALRKTKSEVQGLDHELTKVSRALKQSFNSNATGIDLFISKQGLLQSKYANLNEQLVDHRAAIQSTKELYAEQVQELGEYDARTIQTAQNIEFLTAEEAMLRSQLDGITASMLTCSTGMMKFYGHLGNVATAAGKAATALKPISLISAVGIAGATKAAIDFESAWVGVTKTVDGTPEQLQAVNDGLKQLALTTASSYEDLAHFAELGGQMGVSVDKIVAFTKTVAMLGDTTNIAGDEAAQSLAQIANIMVDASERTSDYYERFGSAVVDLGNNFATTEADIVDMSMRLATAGRQVGMTTPQVMALATALGSMGIKAGAGGNSMSKLMKEIQVAVSTGSDDLKKFAETAGMSAQQFSKAWKEDAGKAFATFVQGIGKSDDVTKKLSDLGITEVRMSNAAGALAQSTDLYTSALTRANTAWSENTAMATEANRRYATLATALSQAKEAIKQAAETLGQSFAPALRDIAETVKNAAKWFSELPKGVQDCIAKMLLLGTAAAPAAKAIEKTALGGQTLIRSLNKMSTPATKVAKYLGLLDRASDSTAANMTTYARANAEAAKSMGTASVSISGLLGSLVPAGAATVALGAAMGAIAYGVGKAWQKQIVEAARASDGLFDANTKLLESSKEQREESKKLLAQSAETAQSYKANAAYADVLVNRMEPLINKTSRTAAETALLKSSVDELNQIYPSLGLSFDESSGHITDNTGQIISNTAALKENVETAKESAKQRALADAMNQAMQATVQTQVAYENANSSLQYYNQRVKELTSEYAKLTPGTQEALKVSQELAAAQQMQGDAQETVVGLTQDAIAANEQWLRSLNDLDGATGSIGESLKKEYATMVEEAAQKGIEIPQKLSEGISSGTINVEAALQYMAQLQTLNSMTDEAGMIGGTIPVSLATSILAGAGSVQEATSSINNLIDFSQALAEANLTGIQIPEQIAAGVASGSISVQEAVNQVRSTMATDGTEGASEAGAATGMAYATGVAGAINSNPISAAVAGIKTAFETGGIQGVGTTVGEQLRDNFKNAIDPEIPDAAKTADENAASAFRGGQTPGAAGQMATDAATNFTTNIAAIPKAAQTTYDTTKKIVDDIQALTQKSYTIKVTKETKVIEKPASSKPHPAPARRTLSLASLTADSVGVSQQAATYAARATTPQAVAIEESVAGASNVLATQNAAKIDQLSRKMDKLINAMNDSEAIGYLKDIAKNSDKVIVMDHRAVGKLTANTVDKTITSNNDLKRRLAGG